MLKRIAAVFYLLTFVTGIFALVFDNGRLAANLIADTCYFAVTLLFYDIFRPVNRNVSFLAAFFSMVGIAIGVLSAFHLSPFDINSLVFFGLYCLLIGYLVFRSTFLPRIFGPLMAFAGLGWLTFLSPSLTHSLSPYNMAPGIVGEGSLMLWLLVKGVDVPKWEEQAGVLRSGREQRALGHTT
jgi:hypothetical protein